ncbi:hypothetical protein GGI35DRAFT_371383 [Trichoderma velutinum]
MVKCIATQYAVVVCRLTPLQYMTISLPLLCFLTSASRTSPLHSLDINLFTDLPLPHHSRLHGGEIVRRWSSGVRDSA